MKWFVATIYVLISAVVLYKIAFAYNQINENKLYDLVQNWRKENNLQTYTKSEFLCSIANQRLKDIKVNFSHQGFDAKRFCKTYCSLGENLAKEYEDEKSLLNDWLNSPSHRENLEKKYTHTCIKSDGYYAIQIFAKY